MLPRHLVGPALTHLPYPPGSLPLPVGAARLTVSYSYRPGSNGGVAITPATYAWLLQFALDTGAATGANSTSSK